LGAAWRWIAIVPVVGVAVAGLARADPHRTAPGLGSSGSPIPLAGVGVTASGRLERSASGRFQFRVASIPASLVAFPGEAPGGSAIAWADTSATTPETDLLEAVGLEVPLGPDALFLDGGRVLMRDPLEVLGLGGTVGEYWGTSAGLQIRF
jgi:hypothetical protein